MQHFCSDKWTFEMRTSSRERIPHLQLIRDLPLRKLQSSWFRRGSCSKVFLGVILPSFYNLLMTTDATRLGAWSLKYYSPFYFCEKIEKLWRNINIQSFKLPITYIQLEMAFGIEIISFTLYFTFSVSNIFYSVPKKKNMTDLFYSPPNPWEN